MEENPYRPEYSPNITVPLNSHELNEKHEKESNRIFGRLMKKFYFMGAVGIATGVSMRWLDSYSGLAALAVGTGGMALIGKGAYKRYESEMDSNDNLYHEAIEGNPYFQ